MEYINICSKEYVGDYSPKYKQFKFPLDHFQKYACEGIDKNENVFIAVATGSGKTVPAEYSISKALHENKKVVYISPIKALSNQKYKDFSQDYQNVGIMTGDNKVNPSGDLVIMTAEIFRNSLYRNKWNMEVTNESYNFNPDIVKYVILDEIHYINDKNRGKVWEEILMMLPKDVHLTMLSATINTPEILASWVGKYQKKMTRLISSYTRPVPLKFYLFGDDKNELIFDKKFESEIYRNFNFTKNSLIHIINNCIKRLKEQEKLPATFFVLSKKSIDQYTNQIIGNFLDGDELHQVKKIWNKYLLKYKDNFTYSTQFSILYNLIIRGIAFHHSGLITILKEIVEILYEKKLIKILFATETFSVGINMPTKTVVFTNLLKYDNDTGRRYLRTDEFLQMAGRAGRRGLDDFGEVIILPNYLPKTDDMRKILSGELLNLKSRLRLDYSWILRNIHLANINNETNLHDFLEKNVLNSFLENFSQDKNKILKNLEENEIKSNEIKNKIPEYIKNLDDLLFNKMIRTTKKERKKNNLLINEMMRDNNYKYYKEYKYLKDKKYILKEKLNFENDKLKIHFSVLIKYLEKEGFIKNNILTKLGLITKEINEINPLVFGKLAFENYFDNISFENLVAFLSIFFEVKKPETYLSDLKLDYKQENLIKKTIILSNYYLDEELKLERETPYEVIQDFETSLDNYQAVLDWSKGKSWKEIKLYYFDFEGNFSKLILRIHNLLKEIKLIFEILEKWNLVEMIETKKDSLIREIVQTDSLYLINS